MRDTRDVRRRALLAALTCTALSALVPSAASAGQATVLRHPVYGGMEAHFGNCPDVPQPPAGTDCIETYLLVFRGYEIVGGGSVARPDAGWYDYAETDRLQFGADPDNPDVTLLRVGSGPLQGAASVDLPKLRVATATAVIPMSDGSTFDFNGTWRARSGIQVFGNDGPATGAPRHIVDRCVTFNALGHQKFAFALMTGTLNGQPVASYTSFDFAATIFNNRFLYVDVLHGNCA
jgi:hypothetical protein